MTDLQFDLNQGKKMTEHSADVSWKRTTDDFIYETYNREHEWRFDAGQSLKASAATAYFGKPEGVDPEEALVGAISGCHLLTFLAVACKKRYVVDEYTDSAVGILEKNTEGRMAVTRVTLKPKVVFSGEKIPSSEELKKLHESAHANCFIANSVKCEIVIEI
jgi:organic hydroperoxide reductase OsmC/OhrA